MKLFDLKTRESAYTFEISKSVIKRKLLGTLKQIYKLLTKPISMHMVNEFGIMPKK